MCGRIGGALELELQVGREQATHLQEEIGELRQVNSELRQKLSQQELELEIWWEQTMQLPKFSLELK